MISIPRVALLQITAVFFDKIPAHVSVVFFEIGFGELLWRDVQALQRVHIVHQHVAHLFQKVGAYNGILHNGGFAPLFEKRHHFADLFYHP